MSDETTNPQAALFAALAKFQAELPSIATNHEVKTEKYKYEYADLAAVSQTVLPLLGKHGLAFTSRPTVSADGKFVLAYKLVHEAGGCESGEYPLPSGAPQSVGSAITYARRYCLYAVTGVFPSGEDDDGQRAESGYRHSVGEAPRDGGQQRGQVARPAAWKPKTDAQVAEEFGDWGISIDGIASPEDADRVDAELKAAFKAGSIDSARANAIRVAIKARAAKVAERAGAFA